MRVTRVSLLALAACGPHADTATAVGQAATPGTLVLDATPVVAGEPITFTVTGAPAGKNVFFVFGARARENAACPTFLRGGCFDVAAPGRIGVAPADPSGTATLAVTVPTSGLPTSIAFQAVVLPPGFDSSNVVTRNVLSAAGDQDGDRLANAEEIGAGTDPEHPDSDGGGMVDGDEVRLGFDPLDASDDALVEPVDGLLPGELVITELLVDPTAVVDAVGEWIELLNTTLDWVDLEGLEIRDDGSDSWIAPTYVVGPGERVVLGRSADPALNGGAPVELAYGSALELANSGGDELVLEAGGAELDRLAWTDAWPVSGGQSLSLGDAYTDLDNAERVYWCAQTASTPGAANPDCVVSLDYAWFQADVLSNCTGCHTGSGAQGGRNFDTYNELFQASADVPSMGLLTPFDPARSYLYHKVANTHLTVGGAGNRMPPGGALSASTVSDLRDWILVGLPQ